MFPLLTQDSELLVNINEHELVPKHEVLTSKEENELLEKYKVKRAQVSFFCYGFQHGFMDLRHDFRRYFSAGIVRYFIFMQR